MKTKQEKGSVSYFSHESSSRRTKPPRHDKSKYDWEIPITDKSLALLNSRDCLETISIIAKNSNKRR